MEFFDVKDSNLSNAHLNAFLAPQMTDQETNSSSLSWFAVQYGCGQAQGLLDFGLQ